MTYTVRSLLNSDIEAVYSLYEQMGWEGTKKEWVDQIKYAKDTSSVITSDEKVVGAALALPFGSKVRIAGVIVDPSHRGHKLGQLVTKHLLSRLEKNICLELDATPDGKTLYEKFSFSVIEPIFTMTQSLDNTSSASYTLCKEEDLKQIEALDKSVFGASRKAFIDRAFYEEKSPILITKKDDRITGFILCSDVSDSTVRLGPWVHEEEKETEELLHSALYYSAKQGKQTASINVTKTHMTALKALNFQIKEETTHMQLGTPFTVKKENYYALWSLELG